MELLQIVPMLPPALGGIGDYALLLARDLQAAHGVRSCSVNAETAWRVQAYTQRADSLLNACRKMGVNRIVDVGPDLGTPSSLPFRVEVCGALPAAEASALFAAYAAHGPVPVTFAGNAAGSENGLREDEHYLTDNDASFAAPQNISDVAAAASAWYCRSLAGIISQQVGNLVIS